jgi:hypothetical protein
MGGGLMQITHCGNESSYLIGNPQISSFTSVFNKQTNFAIESIKNNFPNISEFGKTNQLIVGRYGDLFNELWLETTLPVDCEWVDDIGYALIANAHIDMGGQIVSQINGSWMNIHNNLTLTDEKRNGMNMLIGNDGSRKLKIPLEFPLLKNNNCVPIIKLAFHEVRISVTFNSLDNILVKSNGGDLSLTDTSLYIDYIYVELEERRRLAQIGTEYLIERIQYQDVDIPEPTKSISINLDFSHQIKEIVWVVLQDDSKKNKQWFNWTDNQTVLGSDTRNGNPVSYATIKLDNINRFEKRDGKYFDTVQPYKYHTNVPSTRGINVYSFAFEPEEYQPSGFIDFTRLSSENKLVTLELSFDTAITGTVKLFAVNYNMIRYDCGMAGILME